MPCNYEKYMSTFNERWNLGMTLKPKLGTYINFKGQIKTEECSILYFSR